MEFLLCKTLSCEDFFLTSFFCPPSEPRYMPFKISWRLKQSLLWLLLHTCWFCPFCPADSSVDFSQSLVRTTPAAFCKWEILTLEEGSKGVEMHVDFHSPQKTGLSVFFPFQLFHLSIGRQIYFHLEMKQWANWYELVLFSDHLLLKYWSLLLILSILLQNP